MGQDFTKNIDVEGEKGKLEPSHPPSIPLFKIQLSEDNENFIKGWLTFFLLIFSFGFLCWILSLFCQVGAFNSDVLLVKK